LNVVVFDVFSHKELLKNDAHRNDAVRFAYIGFYVQGHKVFPVEADVDIMFILHIEQVDG
jgi:hypothetical protein